MAAIVAVFQTPSLTKERYEASVRGLGHNGPLTAPSDWPVKGLIVHVAGQGPNGFRVVDVWESAEAFQAFGAKLMPILQGLGVEGAPEVYPAHTVVHA